MNVTDENTVIGDKAAIKAKNFKLKLNAETASLTADIAKTKAEADAWYLDGHTPKPTINVDEAQLNAIKAVTKAGVMDLTFTVADDAKATRTVKVSIYDDNTVISPDGSKFLHAKDFIITDEEAKALTEDTAKDKAGVKAWNADGTDLTPNVKADAAQLAKIKEGVTGAYPLKFTVDGLEKTVYVNVTDKDTVVKDKASITAHDFEIKLSKVNELDDATAKQLAGAKAWYNDGSGNAPILVNQEQLKAIKNATEGQVLPLTFTVDGEPEATKTIQVTIKNDKPIILPGLDNKPGTPDDVVVKPNPDQNGNYPDKNPDGSVTLPGGGEITIPGTGNGDITIAPPGSTIKPDGTVTTPSGNEVRPHPEGGVELPGLDGSITNKPQDNPLVKPEGNGPITVKPDGSVTIPNDQNGTITFPNNPDNNGVTNFPGGSTIKPDGTVVTPNDNQVRPHPEGGVELPGIDGSITNNPQDNPLVKPNGNGPITINQDGSVTLPNDQNGTVTFPNNPDNKNEITVPNGSNIGQNGQVTPPGGSPVLPNANGTITIPGADGNLGTPDDGIVTPNGNSTINPDGSLTLPGGGTVDLPGCQLTVEPGGVVLPNGAVINPGANGVLDTPGYAPQVPGQPGNGQQTPGTRAMADNEQANQGQQDATNTNVNDDVYLDPTIVCATPVVKPTAKPQTPTGAASQVVLYATIIAAAVGTIVVIRRNRK